jgi:glycosyltransferase involved in cell wall biosynthesis
MLLDAHDQLLRRDEEFQDAVTRLRGEGAQATLEEPANEHDWIRPLITGPIAARNGTPMALQPRSSGRLDPAWERLHEILPHDAGAIVLSEGRDELLHLGGRPAWHFPQTADGRFDDQLPADADIIIGHLEDTWRQGARLLLFPAEALWWLGYYPQFTQYLEERFPILAQEDGYLVFELQGQPPTQEFRWHQTFVSHVRDFVQRMVHPGAHLLVVTLGDDELVQLGNKNASHFPQNTDGHYAAEPLPDCAAAVAHLEALRDQGAEYLLVPAPMIPWLDQYEELKEHLNQYYAVNLHQEDAGLLFTLAAPSQDEQARYRQELKHVQDLVNRRIPPEAVVIVINQGDEQFVQLGDRVAWPFPRTEQGDYAGYPVDDDAAITQLEELRACGAEFLIIPYPSYPWLDYYPAFRLHLEAHYRMVTCDFVTPTSLPTLIFALSQFAKRPETDRPFGVNIAGNISSEKGVGEAVRSVIRCLQVVDVPYVLNNFVDDGAANQDETFADFSDDNPYRFNIIQANADAVPHFVAMKGEPFLHEHYNIGYWFWELADFPRKWESSFQYFDELWAGSEFGVAALSRVSPVPVIRIPLSVTELVPLRSWDRADFDLPLDAFIFLFIFDCHSVVERKNPLGLIDAFKRAFSPEENVMLVLKSARSSPEEREVMAKAAKGARVQIMDTLLSRDELIGLLHLSDCYVSLHRSEGFGYTLAEAMSLGKPVIATGYSGNMDFMNATNSFLVNYQLVELQRDHDPYEKGCVWAEPNLDHAAELMRFVYQNRKTAAAIGRKARTHILEQLNPNGVGQLIRDRLMTLMNKTKPSRRDLFRRCWRGASRCLRLKVVR